MLNVFSVYILNVAMNIFPCIKYMINIRLERYHEYFHRIICCYEYVFIRIECRSVYLSLPPTRHDVTHGQKPEGRLKWG